MAIEIGNRRELFTDKFLIENLSGGAQLRLHNPVPREMVLMPDKPWENRIGYITVFVDDGKYRMYYKSAQMDAFPEEEKIQMGTDDCIVCYAESNDGIYWEKPDLGLLEFDGNKKNNIVWKGQGSHGFAPFKDTNPDCLPEERYKAFGRSKIVKPSGEDRYWRSLYALTSPDGFRWTVKKGPKKYDAILDREDGYFDSQNLGFWDNKDGFYRLYLRKKNVAVGRDELLNRDDGDGGINKVPLVRDICLAVSNDFINWSSPEFLSYPGAPVEELYTNMIIPYYRAPHIYVGFPARYVENRGYLTECHERLAEQRPGRYYQSYTDGLFMSSRDGKTFSRWGEAFLRPSMPETHRWAYGECYMNWGIVETSPDNLSGASNELSFYVNEGSRLGASDPDVVKPGVRRHTLRIDGFVSVNSTLVGGELLTKPVVFDGGRLTLNMATSAAGGIQVELCDKDGKPLSGFSRNESRGLFGNSLEKEVTWNNSSELKNVAGKEIRLRFVMSDSDLYSFRFCY